VGFSCTDETRLAPPGAFIRTAPARRTEPEARPAREGRPRRRPGCPVRTVASTICRAGEISRRAGFGIQWEPLAKDNLPYGCNSITSRF
jgi:hypothetical protein